MSKYAFAEHFGTQKIPLVVITFPINVAMWRVYTRLRHPNVPAGQKVGLYTAWTG